MMSRVSYAEKFGLRGPNAYKGAALAYISITTNRGHVHGVG